MVTMAKARRLLAKCYVAMAEVDYDLAQWKASLDRRGITRP